MSVPPLKTTTEWYFFWQEHVTLGVPNTVFLASLYGDVQNGPLSISFAPNVRQVTVGIQPAPQGQTMTAYDGTGHALSSVDLSVSSSIAAVGIAQVKIYPVPTGAFFNGDTVTVGAAYRVSFIPDSTCPPSGDSLLDSKAVRHGFEDALAHSNPDVPPGTGQKVEHGGYVWIAPDGTAYTQEMADPLATECTYNSQPLPAAPIAGSQVAGKYHTHPSAPGEKAYGCPGWAQTPNDGKIPAIADPDNSQAGGGSPADWANTADGYPLYAITKTGRVYKLTHDYASNRAANPNKWDMRSAVGCATRIP